jgi:RNA polymerase sigma-70 factor (ECF subfamily)
MRRKNDPDDVVAYTWFFRAEFPKVVRTVYVILHDRGGAEDIAQEAFVQLLPRWRKVSRYDRPEAWVRRVAIRMAVRASRRAAMRSHLEATADPPAERSPADIDLANAVAALPPQQRAAVVLFYFEDQPISEIADILGCAPSTAKVHLHKARRRLAERLGQEIPHAT